MHYFILMYLFKIITLSNKYERVKKHSDNYIYI